MKFNTEYKHIHYIVGSLRDREVACSASDRQGSNFESCVWRTVSAQSSHHPQEVLLAQFSLYVHKGGLKPDSFHFSPRIRNLLQIISAKSTNVFNFIVLTGYLLAYDMKSITVRDGWLGKLFINPMSSVFTRIHFSNSDFSGSRRYSSFVKKMT